MFSICLRCFTFHHSFNHYGFFFLAGSRRSPDQTINLAVPGIIQFGLKEKICTEAGHARSGREILVDTMNKCIDNFQIAQV
jgi:hypothetical protein